MKVIISSANDNIDGQVAEVFGRCPYFIVADIVDGEIKEVEAIKNKSADQAGGAGIAAAQTAADSGAEAVITGNTGPRAMDVLSQFNIKVYEGKGAIKDILQELAEGKLKEIS